MDSAVLGYWPFAVFGDGDVECSIFFLKEGERGGANMRICQRTTLQR